MNDITQYAQQLCQLVDDYWHQRVTLYDYRMERNRIFDCIEAEFVGGSGDESEPDADSQ